MTSFTASRLCVLTTLAVVLGTRTARCETKLFVALDYQTDEKLVGCPDEAAFRAQVRTQLGYDPFRADGAYAVSARAVASGQQASGSLRWFDGTGTQRGERELSSSSDCAALVRAMSFALTVQIQLLAEEGRAGPVTVGPAAEEPVASDRAQEPTPPEKWAPAQTSNPVARVRPASSRAPSTWHVRVGGGPTIGWGLTPDVAMAGRVFTALYRDNIGFDLGLDAGVPSRHATAAGEGYEVQFFGGSFAGCGVFAAVSGCLVNRWERLRVEGYGIDEPRSEAGIAVQLGPRLAFGINLGQRWIGTLRAEALATLVPLRVTLNEREAWKMPAFSFAIGADLATVFRDNP